MKRVNVEFGIIGGYSYGQTREVMYVKTPYGEVKGLKIGKLADQNIAILDRHGTVHELPPHKINHRANILAFKKIGIKWIISYAAVGSLKEELEPGDIIIPHDFLDFSITRYSFWEGGVTSKVRHVDVSSPFCPSIRRALISAAQKLRVQVKPHGIYVCTEGPRFETPAEIKAFRLLGADIVGMTVPREATLAKEIGICYACCAMVTNYACGITSHSVSYKDIVAIMREKRETVENVFTETIRILARSPHCNCRDMRDHYLEEWCELKELKKGGEKI